MLLFMLELAEEEKQARDEDADKKPAAYTNPSTQPSISGTSPFASMPSATEPSREVLPAASVPAAATMPTSAGGSCGSGTSVASSFTAMSSFASPAKKGGTFSMKKFWSPRSEPSGYKVKTPTRRSPTLEITFFQIGISVACICTLLNERGKESYAWKPFLVERVIKGASSGDNKDWSDFTFTPILTNVELVKKRKEAHGPNDALLGYNDYPEQFLLFSLKSNPTFENTSPKVEELGKKILELLQFESFAEYYIGEVDSAFSSKKLRDSLFKMDHELWRMIQRAKVKVMEQHTLDSFFLDEKIKELVPEELWSVPTSKWPASVLMKLYNSGRLSDGFEDA